jgi:hypothetical protein
MSERSPVPDIELWRANVGLVPQADIFGSDGAHLERAGHLPPARIVEVKKERGPDGGDGASSGSYGGTMMGEGKPHQIVMFSTPCSGRDN